MMRLGRLTDYNNPKHLAELLHEEPITADELGWLLHQVSMVVRVASTAEIRERDTLSDKEKEQVTDLRARLSLRKADLIAMRDRWLNSPKGGDTPPLAL